MLLTFTLSTSVENWHCDQSAQDVADHRHVSTARQPVQPSQKLRRRVISPGALRRTNHTESLVTGTHIPGVPTSSGSSAVSTGKIWLLCHHSCSVGVCAVARPNVMVGLSQQHMLLTLALSALLEIRHCAMKLVHWHGRSEITDTCKEHSRRLKLAKSDACRDTDMRCQLARPAKQHVLALLKSSSVLSSATYFAPNSIWSHSRPSSPSVADRIG